MENINVEPGKGHIEEPPNDTTTTTAGKAATASGDTAPQQEDVLITIKREAGTRKTVLQGLAYGLVPHIGCIAFIVGSILGVTFLMQFFKPLLMNRYFFFILMGVSVAFATLSAILYLRRNGVLSRAGVRKKWKYLTTMYGSTVGVNLVLFLLVFPLLANISTAYPSPPSPTGAVAASSPSSIKLQVDIPCSGHAPLISSELKTIAGVQGVTFSFPNYFDVAYDAAQTSKQEILSLDVFKEYPATVVEESGPIATTAQASTQLASQPSTTGNAPAGASCSSCDGGCGCGGGV